MYSSAHRRSALALVAALLLAPAIIAVRNGSATAASVTISGELLVSIADTSSLPPIKWGPAPAVFRPGAQMAVLHGDPSKSEPFIVRLRFPDGYMVAPHTHPTDEHVTVIDGSLSVGMGDTVDETAMVTLPAGGFVTAPAQHPHYAKAHGVTTVQVNAVGPFVLTYVDPKDMPRQ